MKDARFIFPWEYSDEVIIVRRGLIAQRRSTTTPDEGGDEPFTDDFNRADENLEASANWTRVGGVEGAFAVRTNQLAGIDATDTAYQCPDIESADHYAQVVWKATGQVIHPFLAIRLTDTSNFIGVRWNASSGTDTWELFKRVAGTFTSLDTHAAAASSGDVVRIEASGNNISVKLNDVEILTATDAAHNTVTRAGIMMRSTAANPQWDDFEAGAL